MTHFQNRTVTEHTTDMIHVDVVWDAVTVSFKVLQDLHLLRATKQNYRKSRLH